MLTELKRLMESCKELHEDRGVDPMLRLEARYALGEAARKALPALIEIAEAGKFTRKTFLKNWHGIEGHAVAIPKEEFDKLDAALSKLEVKG